MTAQAYDYFIKKSNLSEKISNLLKKIDYENTEELNKTTEKIRKLITSSKMPLKMEENILEAYENLDTSGIDVKKGAAMDILKTSSEPVFVAVRSSATTEDLSDASFAGQQDTYLNVKGNSKLILNIKKCFASLYTSRATYYRNKKGFEHEKSKLAVIIQKMIDSDKSGVVFSRDPSKYESDEIVMEAVFGLGEGIVSGKITPDKYVLSRDLKLQDLKISDKKIAITRDSGGGKKQVELKETFSKAQVLSNYEMQKLGEIAIKLEDHYQKPQDLEFAIEDENIYIVQTRPITTLGKEQQTETKDIQGEVLLSGLGVSPGIASGKIKIIDKIEDLHKIVEGDILVTKMTNPDMVVAMQKSAAIVTDEGGITAHASIISREMGIPAVVGTREATIKLKEGEIITVDGSSGKIYKGKVAETTKKEVKEVTAQTKTKIKVIVDLPSFAERAAKTKLKSVGLLRIEGIIAESGMHPQYFLEQNKIKDYEGIIFEGIKKIAAHFEEIWVRTSDIRSDEFQNLKGASKEKEANPMLGFHGIRYGIKNPKILKAELNALKRVSELNKKIGVLIPQLINVEELKKVKEFLKEINFSNAKVGVMIETPAAVQLIRDLCEEGLDFISFGTNDLTQYMLAVDRGNQKVQELYDEMHPAILYQIGYVIRVAKKNNVETSICGQAGSKKEMAKFLIEKGIDSISVNADVAADLAEYISQIEKESVKGTDQEPRKYQPEEKMEVTPKEEESVSIHEKTESSQVQEENEEKKIEEKKEEIMNETSEEMKERVEKDIEAIEEEKSQLPEKEANKSNDENQDEDFLPPQNPDEEDSQKDETLNIF